MKDVGGGLVAVTWPQHVWSIAVVDIDRGNAVRVEQGIMMPGLRNGGPLVLCFAGKHNLVVWNPRTGERRPLVRS